MFFAPQFTLFDLACHVVILAIFCVSTTTAFLYCCPQVLQKRFVTPKAVKKSAAKAAEDAKEKPDLGKMAASIERLNASVLRGETDSCGAAPRR